MVVCIVEGIFLLNITCILNWQPFSMLISVRKMLHNLVVCNTVYLFCSQIVHEKPEPG